MQPKAAESCESLPTAEFDRLRKRRFWRSEA